MIPRARVYKIGHRSAVALILCKCLVCSAVLNSTVTIIEVKSQIEFWHVSLFTKKLTIPDLTPISSFAFYAILAHVAQVANGLRTVIGNVYSTFTLYCQLLKDKTKICQKWPI